MYEGDSYFCKDAQQINRVRTLVSALESELTKLSVWSYTEDWGSDPINPEDHMQATLEEVRDMLAMVEIGEPPAETSQAGQKVVKVAGVKGLTEEYPED